MSRPNQPVGRAPERLRVLLLARGDQVVEQSLVVGYGRRVLPDVVFGPDRTRRKRHPVFRELDRPPVQPDDVVDIHVNGSHRDGGRVRTTNRDLTVDSLQVRAEQIGSAADVVVEEDHMPPRDSRQTVDDHMIGTGRGVLLGEEVRHLPVAWHRRRPLVRHAADRQPRMRQQRPNRVTRIRCVALVSQSQKRIAEGCLSVAESAPPLL